ncbi:hypothetical protein Dred_0940 [Desulforamulus reducens MI-1]|uniref:CARDB domain-containing protein n=1 Tax=Desulforamulus reducens (strain ATCC BAA-1160 / DSM 100696 / MI-1) TaxID=349161 RepID=A4J322_DESRM|nr:hypothetical protein [Desulforamulus reducens]ABO49475.1 hypothetical protein Dred_0940 [Desulforamulus reducens MI-1]
MKRNTPLLAIMMLVAFFFASITPAALAEEPQQEQLFHRLIISGYYAMYKDGSGNWVAEEFPGQINKVSLGQTRNMLIGQIPCQVKAKGKITRVEVKTIDTITSDIYNEMEANKTTFWRPLSYDGFNKMYLQKKSGQINPGVIILNDQGDVEVTARVLLGPDGNRVHVAQEPDLAQYYANATWAPHSSAVLWTVPVVLEWYGIPIVQELPDFSTKFKQSSFTDITPGQKITTSVTYSLNADHPQAETAKISLKHIINGTAYTVEKLDQAQVTLNPGEVKTVTFTVTASEVDSEIESTIEPLKGIDKNPANNKDKAVISVIKPLPPAGNADLTFSAVSQSKKTPRPAGTAKWTDWVTTTVTIPRPTPPKGTLDWWQVTDCKITYPKKNPEFAFGNPVEPKGTVTAGMSYSSGQFKPSDSKTTASITFQENWSMAGAKIYNILKDELMAASPKHYPISVTYQVKYKYTYTECDEEGNCHKYSDIGYNSKTLNGNILVNGTGVDSRGG